MLKVQGRKYHQLFRDAIEIGIVVKPKRHCICSSDIRKTRTFPEILDTDIIFIDNYNSRKRTIETKFLKPVK